MPQPLPHDQATANLYIDGLAICCFNSKRTPKRWEIGFLRHQDHHLMIKAVRDGDSWENEIDPAALTLEFKTIDGVTPDYDTKYPDGFFDVEILTHEKRKVKPNQGDQEHIENFRWTLDLNDKVDVDHGRIKKLVRPGYGATVAYLDDAVFYTQDEISANVFLVPAGEDPRGLSDADLEARGWKLGLTNDQLGADITCKQGGGINIVVDGVPIHHLDHQPGNPWRVCVMNMRDHTNDHDKRSGGDFTDVLEPGDFQLYYQAIVTEKSHFVIWGFPTAESPDHCGTFRSGRTDCNTVRVSNIDNLDGLLP